MKNVLKKMLTLAMALVLIAVLLPGMAMEADADVRKVSVKAPSISDYTYTGSLIIPNVPASDRYEVKENAGGTNVGTYTVVLSLIEPDIYCWETTGAEDITLEYKINPAALTDVSVTQTVTLTYDGSEQAPTVEAKATTVDNCAVTFTYSATADGTFTAELPKFAEPGNHTVYYKAAAANHETATGSFTVTIGKISVEAPTVASKVYNNQVQKADVSATELYEATTNDGGTDVGKYPVVFTLKDAAHYTWATTDEAALTVDFEITKATNEWTTMPLAKDWTYGQTPSLPTGGAKFGEFTVTYTGKTNAGDDYASEDAPTEAGDYKAIFTVAETDNYAGLTKEVPFTIERAVLTAEDFTYTEPTDLVYNGENQHPNLVSCVVAPAGVSISQVKLNYQNADTGNDEFAIDAGNYTFYIRLEETANYAAVAKLTRDDFKFIVHKADPVISWDATEFTYDGTEHGAAKVTLVNDETYTGGINYTCTKGSDTSGNLPVDAGTYKLTASIDEQKNYNAASKETTITINPKTVTPTVTLSSDAFGYTGTAHHPVIEVKVDGNVLPKAGNYATSFVNATEVGVATVTVTSLDGSNYTFTPVEIDYLILPDVCPESGVTPENVTSAYQELIDEIQEQMDGVDISTVSQNAQDEWNEIVEYLKELEDAIKEIQEQMQEIIDETAALPEHPTGDDLDKINDLLDTYEDIKDQLTDEEKEDLADEIEKLETEKEHIEETNETFEEVVADAEEILDKDLTYKDKEDLEDILDRINDLLEDPHLTEEQKETLEDLKDQLEDIMDAFDAAAEVEEMIDELPKTGEPDDEDIRDAYEEAKEAYEALGEDKDLVNPNAVAKLEKLAKALRDYKIIKGNGQRWYTNAEEVVDLYFTANGPYSKFAYVKIDGELLDSKYYTSREGSTIVGLKASYLKNLGYAKHTITIGYEDGELSGEATGYFRVTLHTDSPLTGDTTNIVLISALGLSSLAALAVLVVMRKKRSV